jgi:hypothetical protein
MSAVDRSYTLRRLAMKFGPPTKTATGNEFSLNLPSADLGTVEKPKKDPQPAGAFVLLAFAGRDPFMITAAQAKDALAWLTANAAKIIVPVS